MAKTALDKIRELLEKCAELAEDVAGDEALVNDKKSGKALLVYADIEDFEELLSVATEYPVVPENQESFRAGMRFAGRMLINHDLDFNVLTD